MTLSNRKQQLLQQRLASAGLRSSEQSPATDHPRHEQHEGPAPLSSAQRRMWYLAQLAEGSAAYNFCLLLRPADSTAPLSADALTAALEQVVRRHEILRTRYRPGTGGTPEQVVEPHLPPRITDIDLGPGTAALADRLDDLARQARDEPFNLETDAPLRAMFVRDGDTVVAVILVLPHIAGDGGSFGTVLTDLTRAYGQGDLPPAPDIRYTDYALWEGRRLGEPGDAASLHARQLRFWGERLADLPVELSLPFDRPRPANPSFAGQQIRQWLGTGLSAALRRTVKAQGGTPLVALQSAVAVALARVGAGLDIPLGTPVDLRQNATLDQVIGFFSNTVVVRTDLTGDPTFADLLRRVHDSGLSALDHRDVPFDNVVEHINPPRAAARNPLFGVMVTATRPWPALDLGGTPIILEEPRQTQAKFDLTFVIHDEGGEGRIGVSLLYACDLFDEATARQLFELVIGMLGQGVHHPALRLSQLAEFGHGRLDDAAADLAGILAASAPRATARAIRLATDATDADIAAALAGLLERHDALRLRRDPLTRRWDLATAADLWDAPVLRDAPPATGDADRFMAWVRNDGGEAAHGTPRILELRAPGVWIDDESWGALLADLTAVRANGGAAPPPPRAVMPPGWTAPPPWRPDPR